MKNHSPKNHVNGTTTEPASAAAVQQAARLADTGKSQEALRLLASESNSSNEVLNARGVCLMRLGRIDDAIRVFRSLVLPSGCIWMKPELPVIYRVNFATALLLSQRPLGVRDTLCEMHEQDHPSVVRLRDALHAWEKHLPAWQRLLWKVGYTPSVPICISFVPGEFVEGPNLTTPPSPLKPGESPSTRHQVA